MKGNRDIESNYQDIWQYIFEHYIINGDVSQPQSLDDIIEEVLPMFRLDRNTTFEDMQFYYLKRRVTIELNRMGLNSMGGSQFVDAEFCTSIDVAKAILEIAKAKPEAGQKSYEKIVEKLVRNQSGNFRFDPATGEILDPITYESVMAEIEKIERRKAAEE